MFQLLLIGIVSTKVVLIVYSTLSKLLVVHNVLVFLVI